MLAAAARPAKRLAAHALHDREAQPIGGDDLRHALQGDQGAMMAHDPAAAGFTGIEMEAHARGLVMRQALFRELGQERDETGAGFHHSPSRRRRISRARKRRFFTVPSGSLLTRAMSSYERPC